MSFWARAPTAFGWPQGRLSVQELQHTEMHKEPAAQLLNACVGLVGPRDGRETLRATGDGTG